ncbi:phage holin family protein [Bacillus sp. FJAT-45350]|uniref:phage holin family protein n=1 Tax=Bacillus sp. FJAT-45350 TaxID=2011014 RepID=UPI000BB7A085|nr:phage holin family protein [Bacillus sp. FJAT-45350]
MENLPFKAIFTIFGTGFSYSFGGLGLAVSILIIMMALDFISGLLVAIVEKNIRSSDGLKGVIKKIYVLILIGAVYLLEKAVFGTGHVGDGIAIAYITIEFISIVENGGKLGVPIPHRISAILAQLKGRNFEDDEKKKKGNKK